METAIIALGSNLGDRLSHLRFALAALQSISEGPVQASSVWESEPIGPSEHLFYNAAASIQTNLSPQQLFEACKTIEKDAGREPGRIRWAARVLDLDIIQYGNLVIHTESLIIPHREYQNRLFVLLPVQEISPGFKDPVTETPIGNLIRKCPEMKIRNVSPLAEI
ncbi:MAG: 2-amino-4-hydroxy-6-hydroxymethyldihydropteridine diphosphokinase [Bacteroidetes bacterium]|nr:MAG: 2-amino-4-hydroxy-6-hydroxymethyldihydropteridine diphosphokinase [Bacteroidota bacterium]